MLSLESKRNLVKPRALRAGDRVGLCAPAGRPGSAAVVVRAQRLVSEMGFIPVVGSNVLSVHGFMAGTDEQRLADLEQFFNDEAIAGIFCITGGYGTLHLLGELDYAAIAKSPKVVLGCDDNSALLNALACKAGLVTFHGPNLDQINAQSTFDKVKAALTTTELQAPLLASPDTLFADKAGDHYCPVSGTAEGPLVGGNLTALVSLLGTPYQPDMDGALLFLEDVNELNGVLDRWFTTLYLAGYLQSSAGIAFGSFENCSARDAHNMLSVVDTFSDRLKFIAKASCFGLPFGQTKQTSVVPIGIRGRLHCSEGTLEFLEKALS